MFALAAFEEDFQKHFGLTLHAAMALCTLKQQTCLSATDLATALGCRNSHTSKILRQVEDKEWIVREFGKEDRRQVFFRLSDKGEQLLESIKTSSLPLPALLQEAIAR